jgi:hypothetical protein
MPASSSAAERSPAMEHATTTLYPLRRSATARSTTCRSAPPTSRESTTSKSRMGPVATVALLVVVEAEVGYEVLPPYGP